jgi:hypothetical protein
MCRSSPARRTARSSCDRSTSCTSSTSRWAQRSRQRRSRAGRAGAGSPRGAGPRRSAAGRRRDPRARRPGRRRRPGSPGRGPGTCGRGVAHPFARGAPPLAARQARPRPGEERHGRATASASARSEGAQASARAPVRQTDEGSDGSASAQQLEEKNDQGDHEQEVDKPACEVQPEAEQPEHHQEDDERPRHVAFEMQLRSVPARPTRDGRACWLKSSSAPDTGPGLSRGRRQHRLRLGNSAWRACRSVRDWLLTMTSRPELSSAIDP